MSKYWLLVIDLMVFIDFSESESEFIQLCLGKYRKIKIRFSCFYFNMKRKHQINYRKRIYWEVIFFWRMNLVGFSFTLSLKIIVKYRNPLFYEIFHRVFGLVLVFKINNFFRRIYNVITFSKSFCI